MKKDMTVLCDDGVLNVRVGAIIMKDGKVLMVGNKKAITYTLLAVELNLVKLQKRQLFVRCLKKRA